MALSVKIARKPKKPRVTREINMGSEPRFDPDKIADPQELADAYNWYNTEYDYTDSRRFLLTYMKANGYDKDQLEKVSNLPTTFHVTTVGWVARILSRGATVNDQCREWFDAQLQSILEHQPKAVVQEVKFTVDKSFLLFDRIVSTIDEQLDLFFDDKVESWNLKEHLAGVTITPAVGKRVVSHFDRLMQEYDEALTRKDEQLNEAYSKISRPKLKRMREFLASIIASLSAESHKTKVVRAARAPRAKSAHQLVQKMKYQLSHKELDLLSVAPESIIGASQLWVYNTKTRKLGVYNAQGTSGLKVKGSTILGFDEATSVSKKLRKPEKVLPTVAQGGKVALRSVLDDVNAVASPLTGRVNADTILLRTVK